LAVKSTLSSTPKSEISYIEGAKYLESKTKEGNWLQTVPGKSWWMALRMYGPLEPWIDHTWRPGEIELVE